jgi:hypothetical protein
MLTITIGGVESYDHVNNMFIIQQPVQIDLEHSLVSLSKWESKYKVPILTFLAGKDKPEEQVLDYVRMMVVSKGFDPDSLKTLSSEETRKIDEYINSPESATTFGPMPTKQGPSETITSELIYYWMVAFNIPWEAEKWHLNRLFSLIRICNVKQQPPKARSQAEIARWQREENARRREALGTSG